MITPVLIAALTLGAAAPSATPASSPTGACRATISDPSELLDDDALEAVTAAAKALPSTLHVSVRDNAVAAMPALSAALAELREDCPSLFAPDGDLRRDVAVVVSGREVAYAFEWQSSNGAYEFESFTYVDPLGDTSRLVETALSTLGEPGVLPSSLTDDSDGSWRPGWLTTGRLVRVGLKFGVFAVAVAVLAIRKLRTRRRGEPADRWTQPGAHPSGYPPPPPPPGASPPGIAPPPPPVQRGRELDR